MFPVLTKIEKKKYQTVFISRYEINVSQIHKSVEYLFWFVNDKFCLPCMLGHNFKT